MNFRAIRSIYVFEMARAGRTVFQSIVSPVVSTSLYFIVFGAAIGTRIQEIEGVPYGAFIVPGLIMLMILTQSTANASFGIYFPKFTGTIYELLSAPVSFIEIVIGYVGAAATKSVILGLIILATAWLFVPLRIDHPVFMVIFLVLTAVTFSLLGFIIGIWAEGFEQLQLVPLLVIMPLTFLGGTFYSISVLPPFWQTVALFNPIVYLVSGFRWSFYGISDVGVGVSLTMTFVFLALCLVTVWWIFKTGYRLKNDAVGRDGDRRQAYCAMWLWRPDCDRQRRSGHRLRLQLRRLPAQEWERLHLRRDVLKHRRHRRRRSQGLATHRQFRPLD